MKTLAWQLGTLSGQWAPRSWGPCPPLSRLHSIYTIRPMEGFPKYLWLRVPSQIQPDWSSVLSSVIPVVVPKQSFVFVGDIVKSAGSKAQQPGFKSQVIYLLCKPVIDIFLVLFMFPPLSRVLWSFLISSSISKGTKEKGLFGDQSLREESSPWGPE